MTLFSSRAIALAKRQRKSPVAKPKNAATEFASIRTAPEKRDYGSNAEEQLAWHREHHRRMKANSCGLLKTTTKDAPFGSGKALDMHD
jgi:hypothetical protein